MTTDYADHIREQREGKEHYFGNDPRSPIPNDVEFAGLDYFPIDPAYRYELELHEHDEKKEIAVETTADNEQAYIRWGEFRFDYDGEDVTLQAYKPASGENRFWVPFRDETNDEETYGAGRYIDLDPDHHRTEDGTWILDLNMAYNPTCAYNAAYECPLIPMENWLDVRVEAGEKDYPGEVVDPLGHHH